jgi:predicted nucleotide-binding protein
LSSSSDLFKQIKNALLDLQNSELQSYGQHLNTIARLLQHQDLKLINESLITGIDLDAFLAAGKSTQSSMVGSASLLWPDDVRQRLGIKFLLVLRFGADPREVANFGHTFYNSYSNKIMNDVRAVINQLIIPFVRDYKEYVLNNGRTETKLIMPLSKKVFIVHGHDGEARETLARFIEAIGFQPIILHEQANLGRTVIEKVEAHSDVGFAVVLLTPDDLGKAKSDSELEPRARQNVLLELGYFIARLGRPKVCALKKGKVQIPSDFAGVIWEIMDDTGGWKLKLAKELQAVGHTVDWDGVTR